MEKMYDIYIDFTKPDPAVKKFPIYSYIIRAVEGTKYSHVRLRWKSSSGIQIVYEASGIAVKVIGEVAAPQFPVEIVKSYKISVTREQYRNLIKLFRFASVKYSIKQAFGILLVKLGLYKKNPLSNGRKSQICSELVGLFIQEVKQWEIDFDLDTAGPLAIDEFLQRCCDKYKDEIRRTV